MKRHQRHKPICRRYWKRIGGRCSVPVKALETLDVPHPLLCVIVLSYVILITGAVEDVGTLRSYGLPAQDYRAGIDLSIRKQFSSIWGPDHTGTLL